LVNDGILKIFPTKIYSIINLWNPWMKS
jgi:hypothetical protein